MRQRSKGSANRLPADSQRLLDLAEAMLQSGSRMEQRAWERSLEALLARLLKNGRQESIDQALDQLFAAHALAYAPLLDSVEFVSSSGMLEQQDGSPQPVQLIALPILAWTRYSIPSGTIGAEASQRLAEYLQAHVLAPEARAVLLPALFSIDLLPQNHSETFALTQQLIKLSRQKEQPALELDVEETVPFLADTRYLLAAVVAPAGGPVFRWQLEQERLDVAAAKAQALADWQSHALPVLQQLLPGCGLELLPAEAYYTACRAADRQIRPLSLHAAIHYLTQSLQVRPADLSAILGDFSEDTMAEQADEVRISFTLRGQPEILYGVIWPLYEEDMASEEAPAFADAQDPEAGAALSPVEQILALLRQDGVVHIKRHRERFQLEYCDDCGAPLFCDAEAELTHAEMPEIAIHTPPHLH